MLKQRPERLLDAAALVVLLAGAVVSAATFRDYGLGWDDYTHAQYGELLLQFYASGFSDRRALSFVNLYMYGGGFDMAAALLAKISPFNLFETRRLLGAVIGLAGLFVTWRIGRRLGGALGGLIALLLLATCPLYYGHMFMNPKDAPFAVAMTVLLLALVRAVEEYPRPHPATLLLLGVGLGCSFGSRILAGFAVIYAILPLALLVRTSTRECGARDAARSFGGFILRLLPAFILAYGLMGLVWPWSVIDPLNPIRAVGYFSHFFEKPWKEMYEGQVISVPDMPRSYVPVEFSMKMPEIFLILAAIGIVGALIAALRTDTPLRLRCNLLMLVAAATLPIVLAVITRPAMYNGIRHFIFVTPAFAILGGIAGAWIIGRSWRIWRPAAALVVIMLAAGLARPALGMVRLHPYQYAYFNWLAGGVRGADDRYMLDYWGLAFKQAGESLRATLKERDESPAGRRRWRIAVCGPHPPAEIALGPQFVTTWDPKGADFAMMLGEFYCAELDAPRLVEIEREGVVFARVYDIRGRNFTTLFTIPPVTQ